MSLVWPVIASTCLRANSPCSAARSDSDFTRNVAFMKSKFASALARSASSALALIATTPSLAAAKLCSKAFAASSAEALALAKAALDSETPFSRAARTFSWISATGWEAGRVVSATGCGAGGAVSAALSTTDGTVSSTGASAGGAACGAGAFLGAVAIHIFPWSESELQRVKDRRLLRARNHGLLHDRAELLRLLLQGGELSLQVFALKRDRLLRVLCAHKFVRNIEGGVHVLLSVGKDMGAERFGAALCRRRGVARCACSPLGDGDKALKRLSRLFDATLGEVAKLSRHFKWRVRHFHPFRTACRMRRIRLGDSHIPQFLLQCNMVLQCTQNF